MKIVYDKPAIVTTFGQLKRGDCFIHNSSHGHMDRIYMKISPQYPSNSSNVVTNCITLNDGECGLCYDIDSVTMVNAVVTIV